MQTVDDTVVVLAHLLDVQLAMQLQQQGGARGTIVSQGGRKETRESWVQAGS